MAAPTKAQIAALEKVRIEEKAVVRAAALESTWVMATMVLWPSVAEKHYWEPAHKPEQDWLDATPKGGKRAIRIHREGRKTMMNVARCVRLICKDPNIRILILTSYQRTAVDMCGLIKRQFTMNPDFRWYFEDMCVNDLKWGRQDEITHPRRTMVSLLDPTLLSSYWGAPLLSKRADVIVADDPVDEDMVANPDVAQNTMDKFTQIVPLVDKTSDYRNLFYIGTPKSYNDPLSAIQGQLATSDITTDKEAVGGWEVLTRPISYIPNGDFLTGGEFAFPDENKDAIVHLPNVHSPEMIREIYEECKRNPSKGESYFFREFGMLVQAPAAQKFLKEWMASWIDPPQFPLNTVFSAVAVDSALKDEQILFKGDNMVILVGHFDQFGRLYLTDGMRSRSWRSEDFRKVMLSMIDNPKNRQPENFLKEKVGEGSLFSTIQGWANTANKPLRLHPLKMVGQGKKYLRITEALQSPLMGGKVFFVKGMFPEELHSVLVDELTHLGQWGHDDVADCLSLFFHPDIRVIPALNQKAVTWKEVVTAMPQVSTHWTNPAALADRNPNQNMRLSPFGEESTFIMSTLTDEATFAEAAEATPPWERISYETNPQEHPSLFQGTLRRTPHP